MDEMTVTEAASQLRVSTGTVRRWIAVGKLLATRVGRTWRIRQVDVDHLSQNGRSVATRSAGRHKPGTAGALLDYLRTHRPLASPEDVAELERLIQEGRRQAREEAGAI